MKLFEAIMKDPNNERETSNSKELPDSELINEYIKKQIEKFFAELPTAEVVFLPSFLTPEGVKPIGLDDYFRQKQEGLIAMCVELTQKNYIQDETWVDIKTWFEQKAIGKVIGVKELHLKIMKIDLYNNKMAIITFKILKDYLTDEATGLPNSP